MQQLRYRKYPRIYQKKDEEQEREQSIDISFAAAVGILAFTFVKGIFWGYLLKKRLDQ